MTYFEELGGELKLAAIIDDFVERIFADTMIGYLFARASKERVKRFEYEHAAQFLGAQVTYSGRALREAHGKHAIMGGHFGRRRQILKNTLTAHGVPAHILEAWLAHQDALKAEVTNDPVTQCNHELTANAPALSPDPSDKKDKP
jgi:hemoglobin